MELNNPRYYFNRELSWLEFNERVLEEAQDKSNPLMERLKFLAITVSNLDEFFMVRVSSLWEQDSAGAPADPSGLTPVQQLHLISQRVHDMTHKQYNCFTRSLLPAMEKENIHILSPEELSPEQRLFISGYFDNTIYPVLTPLAIDESHPFPVLNNRTVNIIAELTPLDEPPLEEPLFAVLQVPTILPRLLPLPSEAEQYAYILLEDVILAHIGRLFLNYTVTRTGLLRVTRNSDLAIDEEEMEDLLYEMERSIKRRRWGDPVRMEVSRNISEKSLALLTESLDLEAEEIYEINGPLDLSVWMGFSGLAAFSHLRNTPLLPRPVPEFMDEERSMFDVIREKDVLVHHPYMSFDCVLRFVQEAAADPRVLAIKQTLYRVSGQSPIVKALMQAAENGKQVTVLVELKARFDEENNINWAKKLDQSGCHVVYGLLGLKIHCKVLLVVRREDDGIRRYMHFGTGNYNDATAKIYEDVGFFTCKETFGQDASVLFNVLTGYAKTTNWHKLAVSPVTLRTTFYRLIDNEIRSAQNGKKALIVAKMNSLSDVDMIKALYRASMAGVQIRLLVRGICCLKAGIPGISEHITVGSVVDRFLEHSRVFYFENSGNPKLFLSSADWMPRNLDRRVETLVPIEDPALKENLIAILETAASDNIKLREQQPDGHYQKQDRRGKAPVQSQLVFYQRANEHFIAAQEEVRREIFRPVHSQVEE